MDPARMFKESLTSRPELENSQGHHPLRFHFHSYECHAREFLDRH
ncbi:hypothetical protein ACVWXL_000578 [Bradyrhizobium sp. GM22.5]